MAERKPNTRGSSNHLPTSLQRLSEPSFDNLYDHLFEGAALNETTIAELERRGLMVDGQLVNGVRQLMGK